MRIVKEEDAVIEDIALALCEGKTLVYPTETCYGLGCDARNEPAVARVFEIKNRQKDKPVLVVAADAAMMMEFVVWTPRLERIAQRYWPGALTVVARARAGDKLAQGVLGSDGSIAFRVTSHPLPSALSRALGGPLVSTSANIASLESPYDIESVRAMFESGEHSPDILIDGGVLPHRSPSTVVWVSDSGLQVLRQGDVVVQV